MKVQKNIDVWLVQKRTPKQIDLVQYDTGVQLVFTVQDFTIPSGTTATLYVQKPSGKFVYQETGITVNGNTITVDLNNQAITEHGNSVGYQVQLKNGTDTVTTFAGIFRVEKSLKDAGASESQTVLAAFEVKTAEQITAIEAAAQEQIAQIQNLYNTYATKNEAANAIKGNLSGAVVFADDVSPVDHNPVVWVHGKNLLKAEGGDSWQCTYTVADDGKITLVNTATTGVAYARVGTVTLKKGKTYIFSRSGEANLMQTPVWKTGTTEVAWYPSNTITPDKDLTVDVAVYMSDISTIGNTTTVYIQIEEGNTATDYEAYIDPTTVTVKRCGKNLLPLPSNKTQNGITMTVSTDGTYKFNGTATDHFTTTVALFLPANVGYIFSLRNSTAIGTDTSNSPYLAIRDATGEWLMNRACASANIVQTFKPQKSVASMLFVIPSGVTVNNFRISPQLEMGTVATEFEVCKGMTDCIPASDGTVDGMTSLSPNMTILTDTEGVIVECEYNRDTNKVIDKLTNAIIALGGTV